MMKQASQELKATLNEHVNIVSTAKAILVSYLITIPMFIIFAFILTNTNFPERYISPVVIIITIISILIAGSTATKNVRKMGWLNGGLVGIVYVLVLYLISSIVFDDFTIDKGVVTRGLIGLITGIAGGIIGINMRRGSKRRG